MDYKKASLIAAGVLTLSTLLYNPAKQVGRAIEGQKVEINDITHFVSRNLNHSFKYWDEVSVISDYVEIPGTLDRETILYERTPTKEVVSHRIWDGLALNGMGADDLAFEKKYGEKEWALTYSNLHAMRTDKSHLFNAFMSIAGDLPVYETVDCGTVCHGSNSVKVGTIKLQIPSRTNIEQIINITKQELGVDVSTYKKLS